MAKADCPECYERVRVSDQVKLGDRSLCVQCGVELEVVRLDPPELDYALYADWPEFDWEALVRDEDFGVGDE